MGVLVEKGEGPQKQARPAPPGLAEAVHGVHRRQGFENTRPTPAEPITARRPPNAPRRRRGGRCLGSPMKHGPAVPFSIL